MDFILSKVALSLCALLVAGILAGVFGGQGLLDDSSELRGVLREFCGIVDRCVRSGAETVVEWTVPVLSNGDRVTLTLTSVAVRGEAAGHSDAYRPSATLHLWPYTGTALNGTEVRALDSDAHQLCSSSGQAIMIETVLVTLENEPTLMAFAR